MICDLGYDPRDMEIHKMISNVETKCGLVWSGWEHPEPYQIPYFEHYCSKCQE